MQKKKIINIKKNKNGITLISLVITILIMLILAGVTINAMIGDNGLLSKTKKASNEHNKEEIKEQLEMTLSSFYFNNIDIKLSNEEIVAKISEEYPEINWIDTDYLMGNYKGHDFAIINNEVKVDDIDLHIMEDTVDYLHPKYFWKYKSNIVNINFNIDNDLSKYQINAVENEDITEENKYKPWDISKNKANNILAYLEKNSNDQTKYNLFIVSDKIMNFPKDSSYYLYNFTSALNINGLDKTSTAYVKNMYGMFYSYGTTSTESLNLGNSFDTSNVTNMGYMFAIAKVNSLSLGTAFNTINVTDMNSMFYASKLGELELGDKFDTSNVINMGGMFSYFGSNNNTLIKLDLKDKFYTAQVTNLNSIFYFCGQHDKYKFDLYLGKNFDVSKDANIQNAFSPIGDKNVTIHCKKFNETDSDKYIDYTGLLGVNSTSKLNIVYDY